MLDEYLCMGGNEIANNARTYGYATTAGCPLSWFRCEPCETLHDAVNDWIPAEYRWLEAMRNRFTNPRLGTGVSNWSTLNGWTTSGRAAETNPSGSGFVFRVEQAAERTLDGALYFTLSGATPEATYRIGFWARVQATGGTVDVRIAQSSTMINPLGSTPAILDGQFHWYSFQVALPPLGGSVIRGGVHFTTGSSNITAAMSGVLVVEGPGLALTEEDYFSGANTSTDEDVRFRWLGTPDASMSVREEYTRIAPGMSAEPPYIWDNIERAPWYDDTNPDLTSRFYGPWIIEVSGVDDSTRTASVTESILDGGVVGLVRNASREVRVRALLPALGDDALEYGMAWLNSALAADGCSQHGSSCGAVDVTFLAACPDIAGDPENIVPAGDRLRRHLHNVTVISGPLIEQRIRSSDNKHVAYIIEWTMVAGTPWVFSDTHEVSLQPLTPVLIQDVPYNLVPYPSAELAGSPLVVATNYSTNPSVEVNATDWAHASAIVSGQDPAAFLTSGRSTDIHAGTGVASFRVRLLGNNGTTAVTNAVSDIWGQNSITLAPTTGQRYSVTIWGALFIIGGASGSVLQSLSGSVIWRNGTTVLRTDSLGSTTTVFNGRVFALRSIQPPTTTDNALVRVTARVTWSSSATAANNSDIQLFVDTVALTTP